MANDDVLGPRKTMFVLVIVVGCFAVLWPRILSPLMFGASKDALKPNDFDREAGKVGIFNHKLNVNTAGLGHHTSCCEHIFETEIAVLELLNEVCLTTVHADKITPYSASECRKTVNETCGVDIAQFLKKSGNVGKTTKQLIDTMRASNSSCLKEHFGVPEYGVWSVSGHTTMNTWSLPDS